MPHPATLILLLFPTFSGGEETLYDKDGREHIAKYKAKRGTYRKREKMGRTIVGYAAGNKSSLSLSQVTSSMLRHCSSFGKIPPIHTYSQTILYPHIIIIMALGTLFTLLSFTFRCVSPSPFYCFHVIHKRDVTDRPNAFLLFYGHTTHFPFLSSKKRRFI